MTLSERTRSGQGGAVDGSVRPIGESVQKAQDEGSQSASSSDSGLSRTLSEVESQFKGILDQFRANSGFSVETGEQPVDTMFEVLGDKDVAVSLAILLSYVRHCVNHGLKKDIVVRIGRNKPPSMPMNFAVNEELLDDIYPGDVVEIL